MTIRFGERFTCKPYNQHGSPVHGTLSDTDAKRIKTIYDNLRETTGQDVVIIAQNPKRLTDAQIPKDAIIQAPLTDDEEYGPQELGQIQIYTENDAKSVHAHHSAFKKADEQDTFEPRLKAADNYAATLLGDHTNPVIQLPRQVEFNRNTPYRYRNSTLEGQSSRAWDD